MDLKDYKEIDFVPYSLDYYILDGKTVEEAGAFLINIRDEIKKMIELSKKAYPKHASETTPIEDYALITLHLEYGHEGGPDLKLKCFRHKTEAEKKQEAEVIKKRQKSAKKAAKSRKETKEKRERTLYENLKKKYG